MYKIGDRVGLALQWLQVIGVRTSCPLPLLCALGGEDLPLLRCAQQKEEVACRKARLLGPCSSNILTHRHAHTHSYMYTLTYSHAYSHIYTHMYALMRTIWLPHIRPLPPWAPPCPAPHWGYSLMRLVELGTWKKSGRYSHLMRAELMGIARLQRHG